MFISYYIGWLDILCLTNPNNYRQQTLFLNFAALQKAKINGLQEQINPLAVQKQLHDEIK